jgi:hypothetical protein
MSRRNASRAFALFLVVALVPLGMGCASVGTGDPVIVRAEDVQVNSLAFFDTAMQWHYANSTKESPALFRAFETFRTSFPPAYKTLTATIPVYKSGKSGDLQGALQAVEKLLADIRAVWTPPPTGGR